MIQTLLIANRGEIAVRIIRACRDLGIRTAAVFSDADRDALHVRMADTAFHLGESPARHSYLAIDRLIDAARHTGANAVHPGYGLLSESAEFAIAVADAGLIFVGPGPDVLATMGDKVAARAAAQACGVPILAGSGAVSGAAADALAAAIGFPILVKSAGGGGGRGMRVVRDASSLAVALTDASREAASSFGKAEVFLERYLERPRHVEVQILADRHGAILHLGDRDCSVQRRHQKVIEEAPAPDLPPSLRARLHDAAIALARSVGYVGAGTAEFLVDAANDQFFFLEMNPRLQVEHGVTELVTGIDIVAWQLRIAAGEKLSFAQEDVRIAGHAIQARIGAEDPSQGFRPAPGPIGHLKLPSGPWLRTDFGVEAGDVVPPYYDSMIGKLLAWGEDREAARARLLRSFSEFAVGPLPSNTTYLQQVLTDPTFASIGHDIQWLERDGPATGHAAPQPEPAKPSEAAAPSQFRLRVLTTPNGVIELETFVERPAARTNLQRVSRSATPAGNVAAKQGQPTAPIDGTLVKLLVASGDRVVAGDMVAVVEAMKMELSIPTPIGGVVGAIHVQTGMTVKSGTVLLTITPAPERPSADR